MKKTHPFFTFTKKRETDTNDFAPKFHNYTLEYLHTPTYRTCVVVKRNVTKTVDKYTRNKKESNYL